jgi:alkanesulfonate monooxygenase SsuD/methylene tetrahydromethanopterin reductase-like flavin-dependent oxidoreductase (luciferase family)
LDTLWVPNHLLQMDPTVAEEDTEILEAYALLGFLAGHTVRVCLGALVSNVALRPPALLLKAVSTLDALSRGRSWLGVGAGYAGEEARRTGVPLPEVGERFERLEETLQLAHHVWAGDESPFVGRHYPTVMPDPWDRG